MLAAGERAETLRDPNYVPSSARLQGFDAFDAEFFGFSPKEAAILDPQHPGGAQIDPAKTIYGEDAEYMDGLRTFALLVRANGRWNIVDYAVGPTDAFWDGNPLYRQIPRGLLP